MLHSKAGAPSYVLTAVATVAARRRAHIFFIGSGAGKCATSGREGAVAQVGDEDGGT